MAELERVVACPLCRGTDFLDLFSQSDFVHKTSAQLFAHARCRGCGLVFIRERPALADMAQYYPDEYSFGASGFGVGNRRVG